MEADERLAEIDARWGAPWQGVGQMAHAEDDISYLRDLVAANAGWRGMFERRQDYIRYLRSRLVQTQKYAETKRHYYRSTMDALTRVSVRLEAAEQEVARQAAELEKARAETSATASLAWDEMLAATRARDAENAVLRGALERMLSPCLDWHGATDSSPVTIAIDLGAVRKARAALATPHLIVPTRQIDLDAAQAESDHYAGLHGEAIAREEVLRTALQNLLNAQSFRHEHGTAGCGVCSSREQARAALATPSPIARDGERFDLARYVARQQDWSARTFGLGLRTGGITAHIAKELDEIRADPTDIYEWIDVLILALDGAWRVGIEPSQVGVMLERKQRINVERQWPAPVSEDLPVEHIRNGDVINDERDQAIAENAVLRDALEYYAHPHLYEADGGRDGLLQDAGECARATLATPSPAAERLLAVVRAADDVLAAWINVPATGELSTTLWALERARDAYRQAKGD